MRQIIKQRHLINLLLIYTSLEAFRHIGWMLFYEQLIDNTRQEINIGFIFYSGAIMITALLVPIIFKQLHITEKSNKLGLIFTVSVSIALLLRILQLFSNITGAYIFLILWTISIMVGICICFIHIFKNVPRSLLGRFFGVVYFADALIVSFVEHFTGTTKYFYASIFISIVLCAIAVIMYTINAKDNVLDADELSEWIPTKYFVRIAFSIVIVYVLIAGMMDNLYFFDDWLALPYVGLFTLPMMSIMYLLSGFLFDKLKLIITLPLAFVVICIAQTMTFFVSDGAFSYSYSVFSNMGITFLQLVTVIIPICYARMKKNGFYTAVVGESLFYGGFCIASIFFLVIRQTAYRYVMGGILLAAIICLLLLIELIILHERNKHQKILQNQKLMLDALIQQQVTLTNLATLEVLPLHEEALNIHFTKREKELMPLIVSSLTAEEIAEQSNLSVSTVRFHIKNILGKSEVKNRRELMRMFGEQKSQKIVFIAK
ncbi:MAG TPA: helix-turn-helix transcriptional regulator [Lachnospiraceae bacterium]|nr:helix-turn-helix transcriptional regulator [Lachnospiraceae bacterium]